jgi:precorrin-4/cobalt-precorrin-4 C11-methyltransferase
MDHFFCLLAIVGVVGAAWASAEEPPSGPPASQPPCQRVLLVRNEAGRTTTVTPAEFAKLPQATLQEKLPYSDEQGTYEGVLLHEVLRAAAVGFTDPENPVKKLPASMRTAYVLVEAADGYQVVFSIPEIHPDLGGRAVLLAHRVNGGPLEAKAAPYQVIVPGSDLRSRWIRQVTRILVQPGTAAPPATAPVPEPTGQEAHPAEGNVFLVGIGPGDPELISVKAARVLQQADLVLCYSWMKDEVAPFVRPGVVQVASPLLMGGQFCGQNPDDFPDELQQRVRQTNKALEQLKAQIRAAVGDGKTVVLADNGDPMLFSPWGWVPHLLGEFHPVVIPGMSSFNAANAVLQRGLAGQRAMLLSAGSELGQPDAKGRLSNTLVFFTQRVEIQKLLAELQQRYPADTPVAIVCDVSYPSERVLRGQLGTFAQGVAEESLPLLYLLYVGDDLGGTCEAETP